MARFSLLAHLVWEAVLLLSVLAVTALGVADGHVFVGRVLWPQLAVLGILTAGLALSLRTGTPNLAVASVASVAGVIYADQGGNGSAAVTAVAAALAFGVLLAIVTGLTGAPAWAVSLGGLALALTGGLAVAGQPHLLQDAQSRSTGLFVGFGVLFVVLSVGGGVLWLLPGVRTLAVATGDGTPAGLGRRLVAALLGLGGSSLLAGLAGVLDTERLSSATFTGSQLPLLVALGAALLGGASLTGRGGGIAGTVLAVYLLVVVEVLVVVHEGPAWATLALPATVAVFVGVLVSRLLDWIGARSAGAVRPSTVDGPLAHSPQ